MKDGAFQIAFGHHRLVALRERNVETVEIIVRDLSNEDMLRMMALENLEDYGASAWVELETIRTTIEAYGKGEIELPPVPAKTRSHLVKYDPPDSADHPYTKSTVAEFLGWTKKGPRGSIEPNYACEVAFTALDCIEKGIINHQALEADDDSRRGPLDDHRGNRQPGLWRLDEGQPRPGSAARRP
jgi:hypothetical protein